MGEHPLEKSRQIVERWVIEAELVLLTPTHLGNGDSDRLVDMPLLLDEATEKALLPGTSLAGGLRNYIRERRHGFVPVTTKVDEVVEALFGAEKRNNKGPQSSLIVDDAVSEAPRIELRDGVRIESKWRTAKDKFKYDLQLLEAGTVFPLRMELMVSGAVDENVQTVKQTLAVALHGLASGEITLGLRKRRGFGQCAVREWRVTQYDLHQKVDILAWITDDYPAWGFKTNTQLGKEIDQLLGVSIVHWEDKRRYCHIDARFTLDSSLLIRAGFGEQDRGPDMVHLHSYRPDEGGQRHPILSGTSLAGALRHRAERILRAISMNENEVEQFIDRVFGPADIQRSTERGKASRLLVKETVIHNPYELVQNRIRIDRFTGSVYESALFNEQPLFGVNDTLVAVDLTLCDPQPGEVGMLLLLLKDLWTGDLPLGGEASIGRGRLRGVEAAIAVDDRSYNLAADSAGRLSISDRTQLESYVTALHSEVK